MILPHTSDDAFARRTAGATGDPRPAFAGCRSTLCPASVNPAVKPKNTPVKPGQTWSNQKPFPRSKPDPEYATRNPQLAKHALNRRGKSSRGVATSPIRMIKSFCIASKWSRRNSCSAEARAKPSAEFNSSTLPHASTLGWDLETRRLNISAVVPESPVLVTMLIGPVFSHPWAVSSLVGGQ